MMADDKILDDMLRKAFKAEDKALGLDKLDDKKALQDIFDKAEKRIQKTGGGGGGGGMKPDTDITASKKLPKMAKGGSVGSASKRADGVAMRGKTKGRML
jgi:hypothetical protein